MNSDTKAALNEMLGDIERGCSMPSLFFKTWQVVGHLLGDIQRLEKRVAKLEKSKTRRLPKCPN